jgi:hypothetical protein
MYKTDSVNSRQFALRHLLQLRECVQQQCYHLSQRTPSPAVAADAANSSTIKLGKRATTNVKPHKTA